MKVVLLLLLISSPTRLLAEPVDDLSLVRALRAELEFATEEPDRYYFVIDLEERSIWLKAGGKELMTAAILSSRVSGLPRGAVTLSYKQTCPPHSAISSQLGSRLAGRRLPLDFVGRLIEGATRYDRLMFSPTLMIGSDRSPVPGESPYILVSGEDIKSLSAAVDSASIAIVRHPVSK